VDTADTGIGIITRAAAGIAAATTTTLAASNKPQCGN